MPTAPRSTTKTTARSRKAASSTALPDDDQDISTAKKARALVIVESPAKAKTINKYLGKDYIVKSSVGHVRDLPTSGGGKTSTAAKGQTKTKLTEAEKEAKAQQALVNRMGVDPEHGWKAHYEVLPGKENVVSELKKLAAQVDEVYLATDLDREGEAIAWHLQQVIGGKPERYRRVVFNEITKNAIQDAFKTPGRLDVDKVNAQQARRFLDRVVGFMVSPLLWEKIARGLSAGRVQSVAVKLVVEREREIRAFIPEEYWQIFADTLNQGKNSQGKKQNDEIRLEAVKQNGKTLKLQNKAQTDAVLALLKDAQYKIIAREDKPTKVNPSAPYITSTLQQAASTRLGFSVKKTMTLAQRLYEGGFITYMRTDSTFLSNDAVNMVRHHIEHEYGDKYLPANPNRYGSKAGAQEAHEAIRPSNVGLKGDQLTTMERDAQRLYDLIWRQFVSCQMNPAEYLSSTITVEANGIELKARGRTLVFDGFTRVRGANKQDDDVLLPSVKVGEELKLVKLDPSQHFTKPPARFTEASLVKELEKKGIGRPSTYAAIISTIQDRGYVKLENKRLYAEKMGDIVTDRLNENFSNLMDYAFTADLEGQLDKVATGERDWKNLLDSFYTDFKGKLDHAHAQDGGMRRNQPVEVLDIHCNLCSRPMQIRTGSTGVFLGCSGYNLPPKERCKGTMNLTPAESLMALAADDDSAETADLMAKKRCPVCDTAMDSYIIDGGRKLHVCGNNPDCDGYLVEEGTFKIKGYDGPTIPCDKCDGQMQLKTGRFGPYFACDSCDNTRKVLKSGEAAPPREDPIQMPHLRSTKHDDFFILRDGAAGLFLAASKFPKVRETRAPTIAELRSVKDQLAAKYQYLLKAPDTDPDGNPAIVRWSRKNGAQYISSEKDGKQTKWTMIFKDGKWVEG